MESPLTPTLSPPLIRLKGVGFLRACLLAALPGRAFLPPCERDARAPGTRDAGNAGVPPAMPTAREKTYPSKEGREWGDSACENPPSRAPNECGWCTLVNSCKVPRFARGTAAARLPGSPSPQGEYKRKGFVVMPVRFFNPARGSSPPREWRRAGSARARPPQSCRRGSG